MKSIKAISVLSILLVISIIITGCSSNATVTVPATVTVTSTATGTTPAPQTVTVTVPAASSPAASDLPTKTAPPATTTVTVTPTSSPTKTAVPLFQEKNNAHFFMSKVIVNYNRTPQPDGSIKETPIYEDVYDDLVLGGFKTNQDAIYVPPIQTITTHGDWFVKIQLPSVPSYKSPWALNWGYSTVSTDAKVDVSLYVVRPDAFYSTYYNSPKSITVDKVGAFIPSNRGISEAGDYSYLISDVTNSYIILVRASDPESITGWWFKYGGKF